MPYIGNDLATQFQAFATQTITGDGSTSYTLDRAVANGKELLVYINNVKQEEGSGKSYTASGTTITFSEAVASGDSCYLVYMGSAQQTVTAPDGSIVSGQIANATLALPSGLTVVGNTGIGTTSPTDTNGFSRALDVNGSSGAAVYTRTDGSATNRTVFANSGTDGYVFNGGAGTLRFYTNATQHMSIDSTGAVSKPNQPAFLVKPASLQLNLTVGSTNTVAFGSEVYDQNGDFASNTFTAPVTGKYQLNTNIFLTNIDSASTEIEIKIVTSNRSYRCFIEPDHAFASDGNHSYNISCLADMDASDTATVIVTPVGGHTDVDIHTHSDFSGFLAC